MFLWQFLCLKKRNWLHEVTVFHVHLEDERIEQQKPSVEGTVPEVASYILGLEGIVFALRSSIWTELFWLTEHKGKGTNDLFWCVCFPSSIKRTRQWSLCENRSHLRIGASALCCQSLGVLLLLGLCSFLLSLLFLPSPWLSRRSKVEIAIFFSDDKGNTCLCYKIKNPTPQKKYFWKVNITYHLTTQP